jgi:23S rRNA (uracil1939-C5)-methyltransferase
MDLLELTITDYAYGGAGIGRDPEGRPVFVQGAIPGETVRTAVTAEKPRYLHARVVEVLEASPARVEPPCPHYGLCSGCHYQHMDYAQQLQAKHAVVKDQLWRIGGLKDAPVQPLIPSPEQWAYANAAGFSPAGDGRLGFWSAVEERVMPIDTCLVIQPELLALYQDVELDLAELRRLTLRRGTDEEMLAALEVEDVEAPELEVDFPVSISIILPDDTAASLIGDPYLIQEVRGRAFRVSPACFFHPNIPVTERLVETVLRYAALTGTEKVLDLYSGVGLLTAFLAEGAREITAVEANDDAVIDLTANLDHLDNASLYHGLVEEVLPALDLQPDVLVIEPGIYGIARQAIDQVLALNAPRLIYVGSELASLARDSKALAKGGYRLVEVQPLDMRPQTYQVDAACLWEKI